MIALDVLYWWQSPALAITAVMLAVAGAAASIAQHTLPSTRPPSVDDPHGSGAGRARVGIALTPHLLRIQRRIAARRFTPIPAAHVAAWCDSLTRRIRAGDALRSALEGDRPTNRALRERTIPLRQSLGRGSSVAHAVAAVIPSTRRTRVNRDPHLELLCSVLAATADFGGGAAAPIDRVGATLRLRSADGQERAAQSAQARLSAHVLTVVPLAVLALLVATDADVREISSGVNGLAVIGVGLVLNLTGWYWMHRTISSESA